MLCLTCQKETLNPKFCCRSCAAVYNNKSKPKRHMTNKCKICQIPILSTLTYCKNCFTNNKKLIYSNSHPNYIPKTKEQKYCLYCGKPVKNKFCNNHRCSTEYQFYKRAKIFEETGIAYPDSKYNTRASFVKNYLIRKYTHKCSICNITEWNGKPTPLILDHIDGKPNNWHISNLRLICPNCDAQLPTYKSKNKGNGGRPNRRIIKDQT